MLNEAILDAIDHDSGKLSTLITSNFRIGDEYKERFYRSRDKVWRSTKDFCWRVFRRKSTFEKHTKERLSLKEARMHILKKLLTEEQKEKLRSTTDKKERWKIAHALFDLRTREDLLTMFENLQRMPAEDRETFLEGYLNKAESESQAKPLAIGTCLS